MGTVLKPLTTYQQQRRPRAASESYATENDEDVNLIIGAESDDLSSVSGDQDLSSDLLFLESFVSAADISKPHYPQSEYGDVFAPHSPARSRAHSLDFMPQSAPNEFGDVLKVETNFCRDFTCCGLVLADMHDLLQHYEEQHVHLEEDVEEEINWRSKAYSDTELTDHDEVVFEAQEGQFDVDDVMSHLTQHDKTNMYDGISVGEGSVQAPTPAYMSAFEDSVVPRSGKKSKRKTLANPLVRRFGDVEDDLGLKVIRDVTEEVDRHGKRLRMMSEVVDQNYAPESVADVTPDESESDSEDHDHDTDTDKGDKKKRDAPIFVDENGNRIEKPYRCTFPNCDKAYKNANGLKYHNIHGHCGGEDEELDFASRLLKPYVCDFTSCFKRYKNLNGLKYHIEKTHGIQKQEANKMATGIVKKTNAQYGINARSVPSHVLFSAMKRKEDRRQQGLPDDTEELLQSDMFNNFGGSGYQAPSKKSGPQIDQTAFLRSLLNVAQRTKAQQQQQQKPEQNQQQQQLATPPSTPAMVPRTAANGAPIANPVLPFNANGKVTMIPQLNIKPTASSSSSNNQPLNPFLQALNSSGFMKNLKMQAMMLQQRKQQQSEMKQESSNKP